MPQQLDVYRDWLQIKDAERPLNSYQLLRLKQFEDDTAKIREHYRKLNAHVRKYAAGEFATQSQELLNELAKAMLCLTDQQRKAEYDISLGRKDKSKGIGRKTIEQVLLSRNLIDQEKLAKARTYATAVGVDIRDALVQQRIVPADVATMAFAESEGLPYLDLADIEFDHLLAKRVPALIARQHSLFPVMIDNGQLLIAAPAPIDPHVEDELRLRVGLPVRTVLVSPVTIHDIVNQHYTKEAAAAEMAAGTQVDGKAAKKSAAPRQPGRALTADELAEQQKQRRNFAVVAFNFSFIAVMLGSRMATNFGVLASLAMAFTAAGIVAAITYVIAPKFT